MTVRANLSAAISKGREQADNRKMATARREISRNPAKAKLDDIGVHIRAIDKQVRLAHEAESQAEPVLNLILDALEATPTMPEESKQRLLTLGDAAAKDRTNYQQRLEQIDKQAKAFKDNPGHDPLMWTMDSLGICSAAESARTDYVKLISDTFVDVNATVTSIKGD